MKNFDTNDKKWKRAIQFHGHECPGLAIGFKAVQYLENLLGKEIFYQQIFCITENDTCAVDALQELLKTSFGKGNLIYKKLGKMAFNFYFQNNLSLRLYYKGDFDNKLSKEEIKINILNSDCKDLFDKSKVKFKIPKPARIFESVECSKCGERVREDLIVLEKGKFVCKDCFDSYDR